MNLAFHAVQAVPRHTAAVLAVFVWLKSDFWPRAPTVTIKLTTKDRYQSSSARSSRFAR
jgi:hypothetical protein